MSREVLLIGTLHLDPSGPERLRKIIEEFQPDVIATEPSKEEHEEILEIQSKSLDERIKIYSERFDVELAETNIETARRLSDVVGFEAYVVSDYANRRNTPIINLDEDKFNNELLKNINREKGHKIRKAIGDLLKLPLPIIQTDIDFAYRLKNISGGNLINNVEAGLLQRNSSWIRKLEDFNGKIALVSGLSHLYARNFGLTNLFYGEDFKDVTLLNADCTYTPDRNYQLEKH